MTVLIILACVLAWVILACLATNLVGRMWARDMDWTVGDRRVVFGFAIVCMPAVFIMALIMSQEGKTFGANRVLRERNPR